MDWKEYTKAFRRQARSQGLTQEDIQICLGYAKRLADKDLPIIYDQRHLSYLVGYEHAYLDAAANAPDNFYRKYWIPKKSGGRRKITEPLPSLKEIQRWILDNILYRLEPSKYAKAFVPGRSIKSNARFHRNQPMVLSLDIKDFFPSTNAAKVFGLYRSLGYSKPVVTMLTGLCCYEGALPQGAPTSPVLSNLLARRIDARLSGFALKHVIRYTRYADDMTFSGVFQPGQLISLVRRVLKDDGYRLNEKKTRLMHQHQRQETTGVVVNQKMQAPREYRRELRQAYFYIRRHGLASHAAHKGISHNNYAEHLIGRANYVLSLNRTDRDALALIGLLSEYYIASD